MISSKGGIELHFGTLQSSVTLLLLLSLLLLSLLLLLLLLMCVCCCRLLGAESAALSAGGNVLRLVGLYHAGRGPHTFFIKQVRSIGSG
jgi:hypothetical membrane protein